MFEFRYDPLPDPERYLQRIGYEGSRALTRETLNGLVYAHQCAVPFENLDCCDYKKPVVITTEHLYEKIVEHHRGGYCFELNGAFVTLLRALGFDAYSCMCRIAARRDYLSPVMHRGNIVRLDGKLYYCDVGLGGPMAPFAVELSREKQTFRGETYWVEPGEEGWMMLRRYCGNGIGDEGVSSIEEQTAIIFGLQPFLHGDFQALSDYCSVRPDSGFVTGRRIYRRTPTGYLGLSGNVLTKIENGAKIVTEYPEAQIPALLEEIFGLAPCEYTK